MIYADAATIAHHNGENLDLLDDEAAQAYLERAIQARESIRDSIRSSNSGGNCVLGVSTAARNNNKNKQQQQDPVDRGEEIVQTSLCCFSAKDKKEAKRHTDQESCGTSCCRMWTSCCGDEDDCACCQSVRSSFRQLLTNYY